MLAAHHNGDWQRWFEHFQETVCALKVWLKWYGFKGVPSHSSQCSGSLVPQYSVGSPNLAVVVCVQHFPCYVEREPEWQEPRAQLTSQGKHRHTWRFRCFIVFLQEKSEVLWWRGVVVRL